jgi:hypothetical protein
MHRAVPSRLFARCAVASSAACGATESKRSVLGGKNATGLPFDEQSAWQIPKSHPNYNSTQLGSSFKTACGRTFDPQIYTEIIQAMTDQSWGQAIGRQLREDKEYLEMLRTDGGAAQKVDQIYQQGFSSDEEFIQKLKVLLSQDKQAALGVCAIQDAYTAIRRKRDEHATEVTATGHDPFAAVKANKQFGQNTPNIPK